MLTFGPIPSRRLGRSLGINNIPPKICTYSCIYCQQGHSSKMQAERQVFYEPEEIFKAVKDKVEKSGEKGEMIDYLTFVPDGEPTLDINLGKEIELLRQLGIKIAIINNASLIWRQDVRDELAKADWVSVKVDAVDEDIWRKIDHPIKKVSLNHILDGIVAFSKEFKGEFYTETMLVKGINDGPECLENIAEFLAKLNSKMSYISIPTRPPADNWVQAPDEAAINRAVQIFKKRIDNVEHLIGYEGNDFAFTGNIEENILSIISVHPMREDAVQEFLTKANAAWDTIDRLLEEQKLVELEFEGRKFYMRKLYEGYKRK